MTTPRPPIERLMEKVRVATEKPWHAGQPCWQWTAGTTANGYGRFRVGDRRHLTHRFSWEHHRGPVPDGLQLDHLCRNRACCNPDHLEPVTPRQNTMRGHTITAAHARKTHCDHGHEFTEANTYRYRGGRHCRTCVDDRGRRYRARRRAAAA